jgi:hypothetical protein
MPAFVIPTKDRHIRGSDFSVTHHRHPGVIPAFTGMTVFLLIERK